MDMKPFLVTSVLATGLFVGGCSDNATTPTTTPTPTSPTTSTFASLLPPRGSASRAFSASAAGTVTVTLNNAAGLSTFVGLGLGVPNGGVSTCTLSTSLRTTAGTTAQITAKVDAGTYCVAIYDVGTLADPIDFTITLVYP